MVQTKAGGYKFLAIKDQDCLLGSSGQIAIEDREALQEVQEDYDKRSPNDLLIEVLRAATATS